jgi:hypothetical protein
MDLVRGRDVDDAIDPAFAKQRASGMVEKVIRSRRRQRQRARRAPRTRCTSPRPGSTRPDHQAVPAEGPRQGVPDQEAHQPPGREVDERKAEESCRCQLSVAVRRRDAASLQLATDNWQLDSHGSKGQSTGFRTGITEDWKSKWYAPKAAYGAFLVEDHKIRNYIDEKLNRRPPFAAVSDIMIERTREEVTITLKTARPGLVIGPKGAEVDKLREQIEDMIHGRSPR